MTDAGITRITEAGMSGGKKVGSGAVVDDEERRSSRPC
jgi:hypothetical protein